MIADLFGTPIPSRDPLGRHVTQPHGYAAPPGTGPPGETCGSCQHKGGRKFLKCDLQRHRWTHGPGTDIRARSPACSRWTRKDA